ncbi:MAG: helix-turn-helix domain-containing protein [Bacillota bacterium]
MEHRYLLTTIQKAFDVLSLFREHEKLSFTDIQMNLGFSKATLFRILYTLEKNKYLTKDENGRYSLGVSVFILANRYSLVLLR